MQLIFNSTDELSDFLAWAGFVNAPQSMQRELDLTPADWTGVHEIVQTPSLQQAADDTQTPSLQQAADATKRKRRTKAEMEAAAAALRAAEGMPTQSALAQVTVATETKTYGDGTTVTGPGPLPEQSPAQQDAQPGNPFAAAAPTPAPAAQITAAAAAIGLPLGELTAKEHLDQCRAFIGAKGLPAYNETFAKAGLTPNVLAFTAEQRAQHAAVLATA